MVQTNYAIAIYVWTNFIHHSRNILHHKKCLYNQTLLPLKFRNFLRWEPSILDLLSQFILAWEIKSNLSVRSCWIKSTIYITQNLKNHLLKGNFFVKLTKFLTMQRVDKLCTSFRNRQAWCKGTKRHNYTHRELFALHFPTCFSQSAKKENRDISRGVYT